MVNQYTSIELGEGVQGGQVVAGGKEHTEPIGLDKQNDEIEKMGWEDNIWQVQVYADEGEQNPSRAVDQVGR